MTGRCARPHACAMAVALAMTDALRRRQRVEGTDTTRVGEDSHRARTRSARIAACAAAACSFGRGTASSGGLGGVRRGEGAEASLDPGRTADRALDGLVAAHQLLELGAAGVAGVLVDRHGAYSRCSGPLNARRPCLAADRASGAILCGSPMRPAPQSLMPSRLVPAMVLAALAFGWVGKLLHLQWHVHHLCTAHGVLEHASPGDSCAGGFDGLPASALVGQVEHGIASTDAESVPGDHDHSHPDGGEPQHNDEESGCIIQLLGAAHALVECKGATRVAAPSSGHCRPIVTASAAKCGALSPLVHAPKHSPPASA